MPIRRITALSLALVLVCHEADGFFLISSRAPRAPPPFASDSSLVRPLEGPEFFDACSSARVAVVLFHGEKCRSCRAFAPKYSRLAKDYQGQAEFFRVFNPEVARWLEETGVIAEPTQEEHKEQLRKLQRKQELRAADDATDFSREGPGRQVRGDPLVA